MASLAFLATHFCSLKCLSLQSGLHNDLRVLFLEEHHLHPTASVTSQIVFYLFMLFSCIKQRADSILVLVVSMLHINSYVLLLISSRGRYVDCPFAHGFNKSEVGCQVLLAALCSLVHVSDDTFLFSQNGGSSDAFPHHLFTLPLFIKFTQEGHFANSLILLNTTWLTLKNTQGQIFHSYAIGHSID